MGGSRLRSPGLRPGEPGEKLQQGSGLSPFPFLAFPFPMYCKWWGGAGPEGREGCHQVVMVLGLQA